MKFPSTIVFTTETDEKIEIDLSGTSDISDEQKEILSRLSAAAWDCEVLNAEEKDILNCLQLSITLSSGERVAGICFTGCESGCFRCNGDPF